MTIVDDQQMAGVIMKLIGGGFLWVIITLRFFQWASRFTDSDKAIDQAGPATDLTWADVEREFDRHPPAAEPSEDALTDDATSAPAPQIGRPDQPGAPA